MSSRLKDLQHDISTVRSLLSTTIEHRFSNQKLFIAHRYQLGKMVSELARGSANCFSFLPRENGNFISPFSFRACEPRAKNISFFLFYFPNLPFRVVGNSRRSVQFSKTRFPLFLPFLSVRNVSRKFAAVLHGNERFFHRRRGIDFKSRIELAYESLITRIDRTFWVGRPFRNWKK